MLRALTLVFVIAAALRVDAQAPPVQRVDVQFAAYGLLGFGGPIVAQRGGTLSTADLPASFGGGARVGIVVPHASVLLQAEVTPLKPEGAMDRHRATTVSLLLVGRHRMRLRVEDMFIEPYLGIGAGVALYDTDSIVVSGIALQASVGLTVYFGIFGAFVEVGYQRFNIGGVPEDGSIFTTMATTPNLDLHFNRAQARVGLLVEL